MNILGLYGGFEWDANKSTDDNYDKTWVHDSGCTLFKDNKHIVSISEERLTGIKYDGNFPSKSIDYCLKYANVSNQDIDYIIIPSMVLEVFYRQYHEEIIENKIEKIFPNSTIKIVSHHLCHAASSIFSSEFISGSFITLDGAGSLVYGTDFKDIVHCENGLFGYFDKSKNVFRLFNNINETNDFGEYYNTSSRTVYMKKVPNIDHKTFDFESFRESVTGKIMGLSAYGRKIEKGIKKYIHFSSSNELLYDHFPYISFDYEKQKDDFKLKTAEEQAYILQRNFEEALLTYLRLLKENNYLEENICFAGGSFLNVLANSKIKKEFPNIHIPPFTNDSGLHFGAAAYGVFKFLNKDLDLPYNIALTGKKYTDKKIESVLIDNKIEFKKYDDFTLLCKKTSEAIEKNKIVGWFQNRSEFGPRALGSRSILMNPKHAENKDILNNRVKHREYWRPFAGIILEEHLNDYFEEDFMSPHMLYSFTVNSKKQKDISAIVHVDGTCRIQTINEKYHQETTTLLRQIYKDTGVPVVLNTSFNDNGKPIVESPQDAIEAFNNMDIDYLVIGNYFIAKKTSDKKIALNYD